MRGPECRQHGALVLDLARGRLDDQTEAMAEQARRDCPLCSAWWRSNLEQGPALVVGDEVAQVFASFEAPRRSRRAWLAAAAALLLAISGAVLWQSGAGRPEPLHPGSVSTAVGPDSMARSVPADTVSLIEQAFAQPASPDGDAPNGAVVDASDLAAALKRNI